VFYYSQIGMSTCIYCLEEAEKDNPLLQNEACNCNYAYHLQCMLHFAPTTCPLCRITVSSVEPSTTIEVQAQAQAQPVGRRGTNRMAQIVLTLYCCLILIFFVIMTSHIIQTL
jgi:hypothetical protein